MSKDKEVAKSDATVQNESTEQKKNAVVPSETTELVKSDAVAPNEIIEVAKSDATVQNESGNVVVRGMHADVEVSPLTAKIIASFK